MGAKFDFTKWEENKFQALEENCGGENGTKDE